MSTKYLLIFKALVIVMLFCPLLGFGQVHNIKLTEGEKKVFKGQVRAGEGNEQLYIFQAKAGQNLTVGLSSVNDNAVFSVNEQYRVDREAIEIDGQPVKEQMGDWSGALPETESSGLYSVAVISTKGLAGFTLEITLGGEASENSDTGDGGDADSIATGEPKTIRDFYLMMPKKYDNRTRQDRLELIDETSAEFDIKNGYVGAHMGTLGEAFQAAIFKKPGGGYILAYNADGDSSSNLPTKFFLIDYDGGKWTDVTTRLMPVPVNKLYRYDLPDVGTTITVTNSKDVKMYSLVWKNGAFVKM